MLKSVQRDRWIAGLLLIGLVTLFVWVVRDLGVEIPAFPARENHQGAATVAVARLDALEALFRVPQLGVGTTTPFATTYFQPPPAKPLTTRKVDLTYLGYIESAAGEKRAYVRVGDQVFIGPVGSNVVANLAVVEIARNQLTLVSPTQTNTLAFQAQKQVEVPVQ